MPPLSDRLLAGGCVPHLEAIHGETFEILGGANAGTKFTGVREIESDQILTTELGEDPRAKIMLHIKSSLNVVLTAQQRLRTEDGRIWNAVRQQQANFLLDDYELTEITALDS